MVSAVFEMIFPVALACTSGEREGWMDGWMEGGEREREEEKREGEGRGEGGRREGGGREKGGGREGGGREGERDSQGLEARPITPMLCPFKLYNTPPLPSSSLFPSLPGHFQQWMSPSLQPA